MKLAELMEEELGVEFSEGECPDCGLIFGDDDDFLAHVCDEVEEPEVLEY